MSNDNSSIIISGEKFWDVDAGRRYDTETTLTQMLGKAKNTEIHILAYHFSNSKKLAPQILNLFQKCLDNNCKILMVVDHLYKMWEDGSYKMPVDDLKELNRSDNFRLFNFDREDGDLPQLHAKVIVVGRAEAFFGSANISKRAMNESYEIGIRIRSGRHPENLARMIERIAFDKELCNEVS